MSGLEEQSGIRRCYRGYILKKFISIRHTTENVYEVTCGDCIRQLKRDGLL